MAQIVINIPLAIDNRVLNAVARQNGWTPANPQTRLQFVKTLLINKIKSDFITFEGHQQAIAARATAEADARTTGNDIT